MKPALKPDERELSERDREDIRRARREYQGSQGCAIHMSIDHVRNLLRIVEKLPK